MNKTLWYMAGILIILGFFAVVLFFNFTSTPPTSETGAPFGTNSNGNPITPTQNTLFPMTSATSTQATFVIGGKDATPVTVRNFLNDPDTLKIIPVSRGGVTAEEYYSLGSFPYEITNPLSTSTTTGIPSSTDRGYEILFFPDAGVFSLFVYKEPVGDVRRALLNDFETRLGISSAQACNIFAFVWISPTANTRYAGKNVGLPGCPGSVLLPGD